MLRRGLGRGGVEKFQQFLCVTGRAGRQAGSRVCLLPVTTARLGRVCCSAKGLQATFCSPSLFLEQIFPGRSRSYSDVCSGCWLRAAKT